VILGLSIEHEIPEVVTGLIGASFIALAYGSSLRRRRRLRQNEQRRASGSGRDATHREPLPG
jgi:hypothetical protein